MKDTPYPETLFVKYRDNTINREELHQLLHFLEEPGSEEKIRTWMDRALEQQLQVVGNAGEKGDTGGDRRFRNVLKKIAAREMVYTGDRVHKRYGWIAILVALFGIAAVLYYRPPAPLPVLISREVVPGQRAFHSLPDGTTAILNSGSRISFPENLGAFTRQVSLEGEVFFEVAEHGKIPFVMKTGGLAVSTLNATLNIRAYPEEENIAVSVVSGSVMVAREGREPQREHHPGNSVHTLLGPGEQLVYKAGEKNMVKKKVNTAEITAWKTGIGIHGG